MYDLIIRNGLLITGDGQIEADLAILGERIAAIGLGPAGQASTSTPQAATSFPAASTIMCICRCRWPAW